MERLPKKGNTILIKVKYLLLSRILLSEIFIPISRMKNG